VADVNINKPKMDEELFGCYERTGNRAHCIKEMTEVRAKTSIIDVFHIQNVIERNVLCIVR